MSEFFVIFPIRIRDLSPKFYLFVSMSETPYTWYHFIVQIYRKGKISFTFRNQILNYSMIAFLLRYLSFELS